MHYYLLVSPSIRNPLENTTTVITEGDTTTITCEAVGYPPPTIVWSRTSGTLSDRVSVSNSVSVPTGSGNVTSVSVNLTLTNAYREDTGLYECSASNSVGSDNRNTSVTVQCKLIKYYTGRVCNSRYYNDMYFQKSSRNIQMTFVWISDLLSQIWEFYLNHTVI